MKTKWFAPYRADDAALIPYHLDVPDTAERAMCSFVNDSEDRPHDECSDWVCWSSMTGEPAVWLPPHISHFTNGNSQQLTVHSQLTSPPFIISSL